jgi:peroxiredoxin
LKGAEALVTELRQRCDAWHRDTSRTAASCAEFQTLLATVVAAGLENPPHCSWQMCRFRDAAHERDEDSVIVFQHSRARGCCYRQIKDKLSR